MNFCMKPGKMETSYFYLTPQKSTQFYLVHRINYRITKGEDGGWISGDCCYSWLIFFGNLSALMVDDLVTPCPPGGWNFEFGKSLESQVLDLFGCPVHFSHYFGSLPFILVVDFVWSNFRLTNKSVAIALQSCLGGSPHGFNVKLLKGRSFSFHVCNKIVGLFISSLRNFISKDFHAQLFLRNNGGPNWRKEFWSWQQEENDQWTLVSRKKKEKITFRSSYAVTAQVDKPSLFRRLSYANRDPFVHSSIGQAVGK